MKKKISTLLLTGMLSVSMAAAPVYGSSTQKKITDVIHFESRQWKYSKCKGAG